MADDGLPNLKTLFADPANFSVDQISQDHKIKHKLVKTLSLKKSIKLFSVL